MAPPIALAERIHQRASGPGTFVLDDRLAGLMRFHRLPLKTKEGFAQQFSDFIRSGELVAGMDILRLDNAIMRWVERLETKYGKKRGNGAIQGEVRKALSDVYLFYANMVTQNTLRWESFGLSWGSSSMAEKWMSDLLNSTALVSRFEVLQPLGEIKKVVRADIEFAIDKAMEKAKNDGTYSEQKERELRDTIPEITTAVAVQARRALAVMYLTGIAPAVVKGFEINGAVFGNRILLAKWDGNPSWEEKYTPWHEAIHLNARQGIVKRESPLTYAMNYLPLLMDGDPQALERANSARDFKAEDLLIDELDSGAREAGLALATRMMRFSNAVVGTIQKTLPQRTYAREETSVMVVYFLQRYLASLALGLEPQDVEQKLSVYARCLIPR